LIRRANKYIEDEAPWRLYKEDREGLDYVMYTLSEVIRIVLIALSPFIPNACQKAWGYLGYQDKVGDHPYKEVSEWGLIKPGQKVTKGEPLFPRIK
jgi:methionyl-tRNA synthetase